MLTKIDPSTALLLGLVVGSGTALTVHAGKAITRAKVSMLVPFHGGLGNAAFSLGEDVLSAGGIGMAFFAPLIAFFLATVVLGVAGLTVYMGYRAGQHIFKFLMNKEPLVRRPALAPAHARAQLS
jgi:hypothetical protein